MLVWDRFHSSTFFCFLENVEKFKNISERGVNFQSESSRRKPEWFSSNLWDKADQLRSVLLWKQVLFIYKQTFLKKKIENQWNWLEWFH